MSGPYQCTYCFGDINGVHILCGVCENFQLCLQCFCCGAEIGEHRNKHSYKVLSDFSLFKSDTKWKARDEFNLFSAIEKHGLGNWKEIARSIKSRSISAEDAKAHYNNVYIQGIIGNEFWPVDEPSTAIDHTNPEDGSLSTSLCAFPDASNIPLEYQQQLGYLPRRDDYEVEYDSDAEAFLKDLVFETADNEIIRGLKLSQIQMYNERLRKRLCLKRIAREHDKINDFFNCAKKSKLVSKGNKPKDCQSFEDFQEKMQIFARFYTKDELLNFYEGLQREKELRQKARFLVRLRRLGCKTFEDAKKAGFLINNIERKKKMPVIFFIGGKYFPNRPVNGIKKRRRKRKLKFTRRKQRSK